MTHNNVILFLIALILGWFIYIMMGDGFSVGGEETDKEEIKPEKKYTTCWCTAGRQSISCGKYQPQYGQVKNQPVATGGKCSLEKNETYGKGICLINSSNDTITYDLDKELTNEFCEKENEEKKCDSTFCRTNVKDCTDIKLQNDCGRHWMTMSQWATNNYGQKADTFCEWRGKNACVTVDGNHCDFTALDDYRNQGNQKCAENNKDYCVTKDGKINAETNCLELYEGEYTDSQFLNCRKNSSNNISSIYTIAKYIVDEKKCQCVNQNLSDAIENLSDAIES